ncbi:hypothetical protein BVER_00313c [Candidatus Burkholderia verschuerenii]|uniref:DUF1845 domain-containing protein n=1 Tax=Candidatus Burkholderia verschuerenii TaxID=242163 RepID=A0A0L0M6P8_9BURK|nr:hypothetical protein [Candidatus Burkholderia verschuerenii]KND58048.1 hypothetical protein BVER_00313c [Candidatus Burkholderia verschuerenii]
MALIDTEMPDEKPKRVPPSMSVQNDNLGESGPRPLARLTSDDRLARINPHTLAQTELLYCSRFAREFCRGKFNFAAAKMTVARGGKLIAIESEFRTAEAFFRKALDWANKLRGRSTDIPAEMVTLEIKHAMSGRLVRLLTMYDQLFQKTMEAMLLRTITAQTRQAALEAAEARVKKIAFLCIPDNEQFAPEGVLLPGFDPDLDQKH